MASFTWAHMPAQWVPFQYTLPQEGHDRNSRCLSSTRGGTRSLASSGPMGTRSLLHSVHLVLSSLNTRSNCRTTSSSCSTPSSLCSSMPRSPAFLASSRSLVNSVRPSSTARRRISSSLMSLAYSASYPITRSHRAREPSISSARNLGSAVMDLIGQQHAVAQHLGINQAEAHDVVILEAVPIGWGG